MAKKGNRVQVILECTEHKDSGMPGTSRYITTKTKKILQIDLKSKNSILYLRRWLFIKKLNKMAKKAVASLQTGSKKTCKSNKND